MTTVTKTYPEARRLSGPIPAALVGGARLVPGVTTFGDPAAA